MIAEECLASFKVCFLHHASIYGFDLSASQEGEKKAHVGPGGGGG
jgi:hypothetical protein